MAIVLRNTLTASLLVTLAFGLAAQAATNSDKASSAGDAALFDRLDANHDESIAGDEGRTITRIGAGVTRRSHRA